MPPTAVSTREAIGGDWLNTVKVCRATRPSPGLVCNFEIVCRVSWTSPGGPQASSQDAVSLGFFHDSFRGVSLGVYCNGKRLGSERAQVEYSFTLSA